MKSSEDNYEVRVCRIIDARHVEDTGTNDEPSYKQHVQLLLQDADTGATFVAPLSDKDLQDLSGLNFDLHSKELIEIAEWLRDFEGDVKLMVPKKGNTVDKDLLLNTPVVTDTEQPSFRSAAVKRFKFDKDKLKKANK
jgi:hypothetical protein